MCNCVPFSKVLLEIGHGFDMKKLEIEKVNHFLLRKQHLTEDAKIDNIIQIVDDICGLHATGASIPYISLFARTRNFKKDDLKEEMEVKRSLGKIRSVRKTNHIHMKEALPIYFKATKKGLEPTTTRHLDYLGVTAKEYKKASKMILELLKGKGMTTNEIKKALKSKGNVSAIVNYMCDQGLLIRGLSKRGWKSNSHTYYLFHEYFPDVELDGLTESEAINLLVLQYLKSFGPATENDIIWWTGLSRTQIKLALENMEVKTKLVGISNLDGDFIMLRKDEGPLEATKLPRKGVVNFLPLQDPYIMGYKERERYLDYDNYDLVFDRSGNATATILLNGRIIGVWDFEDAGEPLVKLFLFKKIKRDILKMLHSKARDIGRFIADRDVKVKECESMVPLPKRTAGSFMSPLKGC